MALSAGLDNSARTQSLRARDNVEGRGLAGQPLDYVLGRSERVGIRWALGQYQLSARHGRAAESSLYAKGEYWWCRYFQYGSRCCSRSNGSTRKQGRPPRNDRCQHGDELVTVFGCCG